MISITPPQANEILEMALSLGQATDIDRLLTQLADKTTAFFQAEKIRLFSFNPSTNELHTRYKFHDVYTGLRFPVSNDTLAGYTAKNRTVVHLHDVKDPQDLAAYPGIAYDPRYEEKTGVEVRSILSIPLLIKGDELIGIIQLINTRGTPYPLAKTIQFLSHLGKIAAAVLFQHERPGQATGKFDMLLHEGIISREELNQAMQTARSHAGEPMKGDVASILMASYHVPSEKMAAALSRYYLSDFVSLEKDQLLDLEMIKGFNLEYFRSHVALPIAREGETLSLLMANPLDYDVINEIKATMMVKKIQVYVGFKEEILNGIDGIQNMVQPGDDVASLMAIDATTQLEDTTEEELQNILNENAPLVIQVVNKIILDASEKSASDIHIEPGQGREKATVRFRTDGACYPYTEIAPTLSKSIINRIKLLAGLKLDEHRRPQSGKIRLKNGQKIIELRVEITPTVGGSEDAVLRLLTRASFLSLDDLDFSEDHRKRLLEAITKPYGIFLAVGPTGSGKTTTLHALIHHLNAPEKKLWTVEDPVEITQQGLRQVQVNRNIKPKPFDFAEAMRSLLRADPDIIMIGEMRDLETAKIAIEASLTGHLVLSTLHTNSAAETVTRLTEMGIGAMNVADSLLGVLAQRLVRTLCPHCKKPYSPSSRETKQLLLEYGNAKAKELGEDPASQWTLCKPVGCDTCNHSGYKGRIGIHELLIASPAVKGLVHGQGTAEEIKKTAISEGMHTLKMDGIQKVIAGKTTLEEVKKVCID